jgi:hypothetical protein
LVLTIVEPIKASFSRENNEFEKKYLLKKFVATMSFKNNAIFLNHPLEFWTEKQTAFVKKNSKIF